MTMGFVLTEDAAERPRRTIHAAEILHEKAWAIARACAEANADKIMVALVVHNLTFLRIDL